MNANEKLIHATISHELDLRRYSDSVVYRIIAVLNRSDSAMAAELVVKLESMSPTAFSIERLEGMLYSVRQLNAQAFADVQRELTQELRDFAQYEAAWNQAVLADVLPAKIMAVGVSVDQVAAASLSRPFQGNLLKGFLSELEEKKARLIRQAVADGFVQGKTTADIVRSIRGTKAKGYSDGIIEITRRDAQAIVRTALSHTAAAATRKTHEANSDLIKGFVWLATLDQRTSSQCRIRDHKQYDKAHKPIGHSYPWGAGPGSLHWNCRSKSTPILKSLKEITGLDIEDFEIDERASMDGVVPGATDYATWIKKQSAARQDDVLGKSRAELLRKGDLSLADLYSAKGSPLTLDQLRERHAAAFRKAGL